MYLYRKKKQKRCLNLYVSRYLPLLIAVKSRYLLKMDLKSRNFGNPGFKFKNRFEFIVLFSRDRSILSIVIDVYKIKFFNDKIYLLT